jgi:hypothetical protein
MIMDYYVTGGEKDREQNGWQIKKYEKADRRLGFLEYECSGR